MAFPLYRPIRNSFSERFSMMLSHDRTTAGRTGRKRSNQAAELNDVSVEEDSKGLLKDDGELVYPPIPTRRDSSHKGGETDEERQVRRIPCPGRKRGFAKGTRGSADDHSPKSTADCATFVGEKELTKDQSDVGQPTDSSRAFTDVDLPSPSQATTLHSTEMPNPVDATTIHVETKSGGQTILPFNSIDEPPTMDLDKSAPEREEEPETDRISGMPDWAAELDEVVPGVKVISIKDAVDILLEYHQLDTPTSVLFPWMHGIGDGPLGANGPLEQFFGNPSLNPPRYRGLSLLKAPELAKATYGDRSESDERTHLHSVSAPDRSSEDSVTQPIAVHAGEEHQGARDRAASISTFLSGMSTSTWTSTDTTDPSLYSFGSSPQSFATVGTDYWDQSYHASGNRSTTSVDTNDGCTEDDDEGNAPGQPIKVAMHPTCARTSLGIDTSPKKKTTEQQTMIGLSLQQETNDDIDMELEMEVELEIPSHVHNTLSSPTETGTPHGTPPPTPQAPLSAHPMEENSLLRTASAHGKMRSDSPTPSVNIATQARPDILVRTNSDHAIYSGPEDAQVEQLEWSATTNDANEDREHDAGEGVAPQWNARSILINAIKTDDILDLDIDAANGEFKKPDLGGEVSLRNLRIQEVKYGTISDLLLYSEEGLSDEQAADLRDPLLRTAFSIARAQASLYEERMVSFYSNSAAVPKCPCNRASDDLGETEMSTSGVLQASVSDINLEPMLQDLPDELEGRVCCREDLLLQLRERRQWQVEHLSQRPVMYNVVVIKESFAEIQRLHPELIAVDEKGVTQSSRDLWLKEAQESIRLAGASRLDENVWLGNGWDDPFRYPGKLRNPLGVNLVIESHDLADMPTENTSNTLRQVLSKRLKPKKSSRYPLASPRSQNPPAEEEPIYLEIASSCRARQCMQNSQEVLANRLIALADVICSLANPATTKEKAAKILVFCDDGYTETSIFALTYLMVSRRLSLREAYLHLQLTCKRSFFVYQFDVPFLSMVERRLAARSIMSKQESSVRPSSPLSKWKSFGLHSKTAGVEKYSDRQHLDVLPTSSSKTWIDYERFDGSLPSRILPHVYLGNIAHAMNSEMLKDLGITHVVSVGETLSAEGALISGHYINVSGLSTNVEGVKDSLADSAIKVLEIQDVKDDGNDPLRHKISHACDFIEQAGKSGGKTLIHCRVGVSRSASIVVAYLMKHEQKSLLDAYLMTRCRRLNVLIQPNLKFLHELLGWEVETRATESTSQPAGTSEILQRYSWPSLCRDLWLLNKKYLVPGEA